MWNLKSDYKLKCFFSYVICNDTETLRRKYEAIEIYHVENSDLQSRSLSYFKD